MRTALAAGFATLVVAALAWFGWQAVDQRLNAEDAGPDVAIDGVVAALSQGPDGRVAEAVRSGGDELAAVVDAFAAGLDIASWDVDRGPIEEESGTATATLDITLDTAEVGEPIDVATKASASSEVDRRGEALACLLHGRGRHGGRGRARHRRDRCGGQR